MLHAELSEDCVNIAFLTETDSGIIAGDFDAEKLACQAEIRYRILLLGFHVDFDRGFISSHRI